MPPTPSYNPDMPNVKPRSRVWPGARGLFDANATTFARLNASAAPADSSRGERVAPNICYRAPQTHRCSSLTAHKARAIASLTGAPISSWVERAPGSGGQRHVSVQGNRSRRGGAVGGHDELWGGAGDQAGDRGNPEGDQSRAGYAAHA